MATPSKTNKQNQSKQTSPNPQTHKLRTFFAAIAGIVAIYLILASVTVVWLNSTVTNTSDYVNTVAPLVKKPAIQNFVAEKVTDQLLSNAPLQDLANSLLPASDLANNPSVAQIKAQLQPIIQSTVLQIVQSQSFATLWRNTNQTAHAALINQINNNDGQIQLNLHPAITGVVNDLRGTKLNVVATKVTIKPDTGVLNIKSTGISKVHRYYKLFQTGTIAIVIAAILSAILAVWLSIHHSKTARRILIGVGVISLLQALLLEAPTFVNLKGNDPVTQDAIKAIAEAILHNLQLASLIVGIICILAAIASKVYSVKMTKKPIAKKS
ncbi:MAG TPA: hypothetical protein VMQ58_03150 [Candidatus Saccharimonadales bacterium]|nr:hypothetical protein [Candidatus Saccharimonadales bacterium]